jgi:hypothetical protein
MTIEQQSLAAMPGSAIATDAKAAARTAGRQRSRLRAASLLMGWLAFWLTAAAQPCELVLAAEQNPPAAALGTSGSSHQPASEHPHEPAPAGNHCPDVSAVDVVTTTAITLQDDNPATLHPAPGFGASIALRNRPSRNVVYEASPLPPPIPLYLRNQRFLI